MKLALKWTVSVGLAAAFVYLSFHSWPIESILCDSVELCSNGISCLKADQDSNFAVAWRIEIFWLVPALLVLTTVHFLRVLRWKPLLKPLQEFEFWTLNRIGAVSFFAVFILPLRLGELARPYLISKTGKLRKSAALGTIALERVVDGVCMALLLWFVLHVLPSKNRTVYWALKAGSYTALLVFLLALILLVGAYRNRQRAVKLLECALRPLSSKLAQWACEILDAFILGMKALPSWKDLSLFLLSTLAYWGINGLYYYFMFKAFGLPESIGLVAAYAAMAAVAVGMMIPNTPANVGSFWYFLLLPLSLYPQFESGGTPMALALTVWVLMLFQYSLFAGYFVVTGKVSMDEIWSIQRAANSAQKGRNE